MEQFWQILAMLSGPLVGAVIGIFTNYIAVKMLFRPYTEKHIGKWRIPFTPGIIPRRQAALGAALGRMVDETLVRKEDLRNALLSDEVCNTVTNAILALPPLPHAGTALAGFVDERLVQIRSDGRSPQIKDILIDTAGGLLGCCTVMLIDWIIRTILKKRSASPKKESV